MAKKKRDLANPLSPSEGLGEYGVVKGAKAGAVKGAKAGAKAGAKSGAKSAARNRGLKRGIPIAMAELYSEGLGAVGNNKSKKKK